VSDIENLNRRSLLASTFALPEKEPLPQAWEALLDALIFVQYAPQDIIVLEGDPGDALYIIESGKAFVWNGAKDGERKLIGELFAGDIIGELALLTGAARAATVTAATAVSVLQLRREEFEGLSQIYPSLSGLILSKNYKRLTTSYHQLAEKNEQLKASHRAQVELGTIFICVVLLMSVYSFVLSYFKSELFLALSFAETIEFVVTRCLEVITFLIIFWMLRASKIPIREFGLNLIEIRKQTLESVWISFLVMLSLLGLKYFGIQTGRNPFPNETLINWSYWDWSYVSYILIAPLQEFIARGVFQSTVARLIVSERSALLSILVTSVLFGALHLHTSVLLGIAAFTTSWLWGWMFARQRSLVGVSISHFMIGNFAGLLGFWTLL
jgi:CRP-like cAMP-binding protein